MSTTDVCSPVRPFAQREDGKAPVAQPLRIRKLVKRVAIGAGVVLVLGLAAAGGRYYWTTGRFIESTNDAYVQADSIIVAPKVSGYIVDLRVDDNQPVKAGQVLARIDPRDFRNSLNEASANVAAATASIADLDAQIVAQHSVIRQAAEYVTEARDSLSLARRNELRRRKMAQVGYGSDELADDATTDAQEKAAALTRLEAAHDAAQEQINVLLSQRALAAAQLSRAQALHRQAELNLGYATLVAPSDGVVGDRTVRVGQYVQAGTQLMAVVPLQRVYVTANFKETQLTDVKAGQPVQLRVDTFPGQELHGRVQSLAPASGLEFSLLPPDNATGNFTKIVQRIPVKIVLSPDEALAERLRPGMSVTASIDTKPRVLAPPALAANRGR
jgi:membrane fusion protein, multidrug efflux system